MDEDEQPITYPQVITTVYIWQALQVMVFDQHGKQITSYQGKLADVYDRLLRDAPESTIWYMGNFPEKWYTQVSRNVFIAFARFKLAAGANR